MSQLCVSPVLLWVAGCSCWPPHTRPLLLLLLPLKSCIIKFFLLLFLAVFFFLIFNHTSFRQSSSYSSSIIHHFVLYIYVFPNADRTADIVLMKQDIDSITASLINCNIDDAEILILVTIALDPGWCWLHTGQWWWRRHNTVPTVAVLSYLS